MIEDKTKLTIEAALMVAGRPLDVAALRALFEEYERPDRAAIHCALAQLRTDFEQRSFELKEVASGYRIQVRAPFAAAILRLWEEKPARYSRATLETLALIAYRQPITRGEIEEVRGVSVSTQIIRTLLERGWAHVIGHREVPGRPALYGTTPRFLDYFNLKSLADLPPLTALQDLSRLDPSLPEASPDAAAPTTTEAPHGPTAMPVAPSPDAAAGQPVETGEPDPQTEPQRANHNGHGKG